MALDLQKYRTIFLEEAAEHLAEIGRSLLVLEKDPASVDAIDTIFRMAHSIKSMAASLGYDSITEVSHALEDHMERVRSAGRIEPTGELPLLWTGLEALEAMVESVREHDEAPPADAALLASLREEASDESPEEEVPGASSPSQGPDRPTSAAPPKKP